MKKIVAILITVLTICGGLYGFKLVKERTGQEEFKIDTEISVKLKEVRLYPLYESLDNESRDWYNYICSGAKNFEKEIFIGEFASENETTRVAEKIENIYTEIFYEQAEYFWIDPHACNIILKSDGNNHRLYIEPAYTMNESSVTSRKNIFEKELEYIVNNAAKKPSVYDKVLYVYDYLLQNTEYDYEMAKEGSGKDFNRSAYGCLVSRKTVCSGYSMAFQLIMRELDIVCGSEFSSYSGFEIDDGHVWNYCKLDDEYYYFDLTWDDTGFDSKEYKPYFDYTHDFFAITRDELVKSHTVDKNAPTPYCGGTKYNYFIYNGLNFESYNENEIENAILNRKTENYIALRFSSKTELQKARNDLLESGKIYDIIQGINNISFTVDESGLHLYIFF